MHRPSPACPNCGTMYPVIGRQVEEVEGELVEVTERAMPAKQEIGMTARTEGLPGLIAYGKAKGYQNPAAWARKQMQVRGLNANR